MSAGLQLLVLATASVFSFMAVNFVSGSVSSCLLNRLDYLPCKFNHTTQRPGENQVGIYQTKIRETILPCCRVKKKLKHVRIEDILDLDGVLVVHSPGYEADPQELYSNTMLAEYNIHCAENDIIYFQLTAMDVEPMNCFNDFTGEMVCRDYLHVHLGSYGIDESCGSDYSDNYYLLPSNDLKLWFRTSVENRFLGFQGYAVCIPPSSSKRASCSETSSNPPTTSTTNITRTSATCLTTKLLTTPELDEETERPTSHTENPPVAPSLRPPLAEPTLYRTRRVVHTRSTLPPTPDERGYPTEESDIDETEYIVPVDFRKAQLKISPADKKSLKPQFTPEDREVLDTLVESLFALGKAGNSTRLEARGLQRCAVRLALENTRSCNRIVKAVSQSYISVASRMHPEEFREIAAPSNET